MNASARILLSLAVAGFLLAILMWWGGVSPGELMAAVGELPLSTYLLALAVHVGIYLLRSARFLALMPRAERPSFAAVLAASASHNLAAYVLPAKTGEASLIVYLRSHGGVGAAAGLATLLVSRLLDLATLCAIVAAAALFLRAEVAPDFRPLVVPLAAGLFAAAVLLSIVCARPELLSAGAAAVARRLGLGRMRLGAAALAKVETVSAALRAAAARRKLVVALGLSLGLWAMVFLFYAVLARGAGLGADLSYVRATFGASLAVLFNLLPINGFAGFGTQEAGWKVGFMLIGVEGGLALSTGFAVHLVQLANVALLGLLGHLAMGILPAAAPASDAD
ncbi:lysylphosphatidylglycerol synthase transmembrane domain-containing protein [Engelhardtia mirabilis]|uniref:Flippase-like domain-containing protein n=1 Tax=Engelhardtia mirabilis TaxID=2528011 RepID=A0A518BS04_9BACT|nr:hypothetical protein Pla133_48680 [Planctomycetes bacterium Pla133]QDV04072.1 hypothetical protein Pla86_48660 [Planctomycetes bacterium Pla86]